MLGHRSSANSQPNEESNITGLIKISGCDNPSRRGDVVFVHGLAGHARNTWHWQNPKDKGYEKDNFWLTWLGNDLDVGIWTFGYSAARLKANGSAMSLFDQASNFLDYLENFGIGERPVVFVTHSMGGLLVKKMLNVVESFLEVESKKAVFESTQGITFLSTPHLGSDVARWTQAFASFFTVNVKELIADNDELRRLNEWYRQKFDTLGAKTKVYYETKPTNGVFIVNESSANPSIRNVQPIAVDADHDSIAKPKPGDSKVYLGVKKFIKECFQSQKALPPADNAVPQAQPIDVETVNPLLKHPPELNYINKIHSSKLLFDKFRAKLVQSQINSLTLFLVGCTGVGKTSLVNALINSDQREPEDWKHLGKGVEIYLHNTLDIKFSIIETYGWYSDIKYFSNENEQKFEQELRSKMPKIDCFMFLQGIEQRMDYDSRYQIESVTQLFGDKIWEKSIIILTKAKRLPYNLSYTKIFNEKKKLFQRAIAQNIGLDIASQIPILAVETMAKTTPDGEEWLEKLYETILNRVLQ